eukprot:TRINITY_DN108_c0_g2_i1.p1 TRINITY_DN108_c0_g2~~TRINITY_DN108_c0_g2_i1.p1  ORF type:complete len:355 (+),score=20.43 TRINITY_DN108_c0_g2_i1:92-1066(+)
MAPKGGRGRGKTKGLNNTSTKKEGEEVPNTTTNQNQFTEVAKIEHNTTEINSKLTNSRVVTQQEIGQEQRPSVSNKTSSASFSIFHLFYIVLVLAIGIYWSMWRHLLQLQAQMIQIKNETRLAVRGMESVISEAQHQQLMEIKQILVQEQLKVSNNEYNPILQQVIVKHGELDGDAIHGKRYSMTNMVLNGVSSWVGVHPLINDIILSTRVTTNRYIALKLREAYLQFELSNTSRLQSLVIEQAQFLDWELQQCTPKIFRVIAWKYGHSEAIEVGRGEYNLQGTPKQVFQLGSEEVDFVQVEVQSTYGNPNMTCIYHMSVAGFQ